MSLESRMIARAYPLRVRDVGFVGETPAIVRANWDIVEVRDLDGELLMRAEVSGANELLFHPHMRLAAGRYLLVEVGGGISAAGFRAWDFVERRWTMQVLDHWDDVALVGVDVARALAAVSDGKGIDVFDVPALEQAWRIPVGGVASVDFNPADPEITVVGGDPFMLGGGELPGAPLAAVFQKSEQQFQRALPELSWDGPTLAWLDAARIVLLSPAGELGLLSAELEPLESLGRYADANELRVADARWVALHGDAATTLVDATGEAAPTTLPDFCTMLPGRDSVIRAEAQRPSGGRGVTRR